MYIKYSITEYRVQSCTQHNSGLRPKNHDGGIFSSSCPTKPESPPRNEHTIIKFTKSLQRLLSCTNTSIAETRDNPRLGTGTQVCWIDRSGGYRTPGSRSGPGLGNVQIQHHKLTFTGNPSEWFAVRLNNDTSNRDGLRRRATGYVRLPLIRCRLLQQRSAKSNSRRKTRV